MKPGIDRWFQVHFFSAVLSICGTQGPLLAQPRGASKEFTKDCNRVQDAVLPYMRQRHWEVDADGKCRLCFKATTKKVLDKDEKAVATSRDSLEKITGKDLKFADSKFPETTIYSGLSAVAFLDFAETSNGCRATLRFEYGWYGSRLWLGVPISGSRMTGYSSSLLEDQYLNTIASGLR